LKVKQKQNEKEQKQDKEGRRMLSITCAFSAYPTHPVRISITTTSTIRYASRFSVPINPFVPEVLAHSSIFSLHNFAASKPFRLNFVAMQVIEAVDALHSEFRAVDNLVAYNTTRVLKAFHNARLGSHVCNYVLSFR
jgi:hypothetical protein